MHKLLLKSLIGIICLTAAAGLALSAVDSGEAAPDFALPSVSGKNLRLSEYRSEVVIISFWSSWCGRCRDALPALQSLRSQYADDDLHVLAIAIEGDADLAKRTAAELGVQFPMLLDQQGQVSRAYDLGKLPYTVVIDREGRVVTVDKGFRKDSWERVSAEVAALLAE